MPKGIKGIPRPAPRCRVAQTHPRVLPRRAGVEWAALASTALLLACDGHGGSKDSGCVVEEGASISTSMYLAEISSPDFELRVRGMDGTVLLSSSDGLHFADVEGQTEPSRVRSSGPWIEAAVVTALACTEREMVASLAPSANDAPVMQMTVYTGDADHELRLRVEWLGEPPRGVPHLELGLAQSPEDRFYGMGERFVEAEHSGNSMFVWAEEGCVFDCEDEVETYFPVPFYLASPGYGFLLDDTRFSRFDFGKTEPGKTAITLYSTSMEVRLFFGDEPLDIIEAYTGFAGRMPSLPAPWVFAPWVSANDTHKRDNENAEERTREIAAIMRDNRIPTSGIWNEDWAGGNGELLYVDDFVASEKNYPNWAQMVRDLQAQGFRILAYLKPYLSVGTTDYETAGENGYLVLGPDGQPATFWLIVDRAQLDLTNPQAVAWWTTTIYERAAEFGIDGWMNDFGEYTPTEARFFDGRDGWELHNAYPRMWARVARQYWDERRPDGDYVFFSRSGYTGSWQYSPVVWTGDQDTTWSDSNGLPAVIAAATSLGISGVPVVATDIGGFLCLFNPPADRELFYRWTQLGAMLPVMREHNGQFGCADNWLIDNDLASIDHWKKYAVFHTRLFPYFYTLAAQARDRGWPIVRHLVLHFPDAPGTKERQDDQFLVGDRILVAPVIEPEARTRSVYFPPGTWVHWESGKAYVGPAEQEVDAPLESALYFYRAGLIIPHFDAPIDSLAEEEDPALVGFSDANAAMTILFHGEGRDELTLWDGTAISCDSAAGHCDVSDAPVERTYTFDFRASR